MRIGFLHRHTASWKWGGDTKALEQMAQGLSELGHEAEIFSNPFKAAGFEYLFLSNTCLDLRPGYNLLRLWELPYSLVAFHEDASLFMRPMTGLFRYVQGVLRGEPLFSLESLEENPDLALLYGEPHRDKVEINYGVMRDAQICIASSPFEARTLKRDCPPCNVKTFFYPPGFATKEALPTDAFLRWTGLRSGEYILQVGRIERRKNQLATILATRNLDQPLVLIATMTTQADYEEACLEAIYRWRRAPTWIISETIPSMQAGPLKILQMPGGKKLSPELLLSAMAHAGLYLHPAFHELPGLVYLEAIQMGRPVVASEWTALSDYLEGYPTENQVGYAKPYDIPAIRKLTETLVGRSGFAVHPQIPILKRSPKEWARELEPLLAPPLPASRSVHGPRHTSDRELDPSEDIEA